ncbi:hypothetical protein OGZ02_00075 [Brachyspira hyodysenteriae]|nr:hypothetical protein [Brachyspira hyodysenteriae]MDA1467274.1 hypothetical protein [Brachyspira hyodysenteriae]
MASAYFRNRRIDRGSLRVIWIKFNDKINLLEDGKIELEDKKNDNNFNKSLIENINNIETLKNNYSSSIKVK